MVLIPRCSSPKIFSGSLISILDEKGKLLQRGKKPQNYAENYWSMQQSIIFNQSLIEENHTSMINSEQLEMRYQDQKRDIQLGGSRLDQREVFILQEAHKPHANQGNFQL